MPSQRTKDAITARFSISPHEPAPDHFRVATWNVNSLKAHSAHFGRLLQRARPDVVLLQETKSPKVAPEVTEMLQANGYTIVNVGAGGYNGVAIASLHPMRDIQKIGDFGNEHLDKEPRLITCVVGAPKPMRVASVYVPHGREIGHWHYEYKLHFLAALADKVKEWVAEGAVVLGGDFNVAPTDDDLHHVEAFKNKKGEPTRTHVTDLEKQALASVFEAGLIDLDVKQHGADARRFTWWASGFSYGVNLGMRIDFLGADAETAKRLVATWIDHIERGSEHPSDHAALIADFK